VKRAIAEGKIRKSRGALFVANVSRLLDRVRYYAERGDAGMIEVTPESAEFLAKPRA
jgi:hypothetical protein